MKIERIKELFEEATKIVMEGTWYKGFCPGTGSPAIAQSTLIVAVFNQLVATENERQHNIKRSAPSEGSMGKHPLERDLQEF